MANYSKQSIFKPFLLSIAVTSLIGLFFLSSFAMKLFLTSNKKNIEAVLSSSLKQPTTIESIHYVPPVFIILKNVAAGQSLGVKYLPLSIERITLVFSFKELIRDKKIVFTKIYCIKLKIDMYNYPFFFKESIEGVVEIITLLARGRPIKIVLEDAFCVLNRKGNTANSIKTTTRIEIGPHRNIAAYGWLDLCAARINNECKNMSKDNGPGPLRYRIQGAVIEKGLDIDLLNFERGNFKANFEGQLLDNALTLKGFSTIENFYSDFLAVSNKSGELIEKLKAIILYHKIPQKIGISIGGINILDIDCVIKFVSQKVTLENISFSVNNTPVRAAGELMFKKKVFFKGQISVFPDVPSRPVNPKKLELFFQGQSRAGKCDGNISFNFFKIIKSEIVSQKVEAEFKNLSFGLFPDSRLKIFILDLILSYYCGDKIYKFDLADFDAVLNFINKRVKFVKFDSRIFDGSMRGHIGADIAQKPLRVNCHLEVEDVSANELNSLLLSFFSAYQRLPASLESHVFGTFACNVNYINTPVEYIAGDMTIKNGYLDNVRFFVWLSDFFNIACLKRVDFNTIFSKFAVSDKEILLEDVDIDAQELSLNGMFKMKEEGMISSKLSLSLSRRILETSSKFEPLLSLMDKDIPALNFDFQLSGFYNAINFQWFESDFKQKIKKMLPGFMERGIENKIEKAVQAISQ